MLYISVKLKENTENVLHRPTLLLSFSANFSEIWHGDLQDVEKPT
jgi:hypothetical protein